MKNKKIVITGAHSSGTALIEEIKKRHPSWQIFYLGTKYAFEGQWVLSYDYCVVSKIRGISFIPIITGRLQRKFSWATIISLVKVPIGFFQSFYHLLKIKPDIIVSFGGYLSVPVVVAGWILQIPAIAHEQTQTIGLSNKITLPFVKKLAFAFPEPLKQAPLAKRVFTGIPLRNGLGNKTDPGALKPIAELGRKTKKPFLYVTGGKTGAQTINQLIFASLPDLLEKYLVAHQVGVLDLDRAEKARKKLPSDQRNHYLPLKFLSGEEVGWILNHASLVVSRAGAHSVWELTALEKRAILIPIPWSYKNEQQKNADFFVSTGLGVSLSQETTTPEIFQQTIVKMEKDSLRPKKGKKTDFPDGRKRLLKEVEKIIRK